MRPIETAAQIMLCEAGVERTNLSTKDTPRRFAEAFAEYVSGYNQDAGELLTAFDAEGYDTPVTVRDIPFYSLCEHHLAPFFGTVTISYIPNGKIVGLSKLVRLVRVFSKRLQVQERMTMEIGAALAHSDIAPARVTVEVSGRHLCMEARGVCQAGATTETFWSYP
jgi:GTP cyclohydrolase I